MAVMPATLAILSIVFVESIYSAAGVTGQGDTIEHKLLSLLVLACIGVANSISTKASTRLNNFFVAAKFVTIAAIVLAGIAVVIIQLADPQALVGGRDWIKKPWFGNRDSVDPDGHVTHWAGLSEWELFGHLSAALYAALWAYSGWDKVSQQPGVYSISVVLTNPRPFISRRSSQVPPASCPWLSTPLFRPSFCVSSRPMLPIISCCHGMLYRQQTV